MLRFLIPMHESFSSRTHQRFTAPRTPQGLGSQAARGKGPCSCVRVYGHTISEQLTDRLVPEEELTAHAKGFPTCILGPRWNRGTGYVCLTYAVGGPHDAMAQQPGVPSVTREAWQSWVGFHLWRKREAMRGMRPQPETDPEDGLAVDRIGIALLGSVSGRRRDGEDLRATCVKGYEPRSPAGPAGCACRCSILESTVFSTPRFGKLRTPHSEAGLHEVVGPRILPGACRDSIRRSPIWT